MLLALWGHSRGNLSGEGEMAHVLPHKRCQRDSGLRVKSGMHGGSSLGHSALGLDCHFPSGDKPGDPLA